MKDFLSFRLEYLFSIGHAEVGLKYVCRRLNSKFATCLLVLALYLTESNAAEIIQCPQFNYMKDFLSFRFEYLFSIGHAEVGLKYVCRRLNSKFTTCLLVLALYLTDSNAAEIIQCPQFNYMKDFLSFRFEYLFSIGHAEVGLKYVCRRLNSKFATCLLVLALYLTESNAAEIIQCPQFNYTALKISQIDINIV